MVTPVLWDAQRIVSQTNCIVLVQLLMDVTCLGSVWMDLPQPPLVPKQLALYSVQLSVRMDFCPVQGNRMLTDVQPKALVQKTLQIARVNIKDIQILPNKNLINALICCLKIE